jgi:hypothetical protein
MLKGLYAEIRAEIIKQARAKTWRITVPSLIAKLPIRREGFTPSDFSITIVSQV